jgi:YHS domain-containing protein
MRLRAAGAMPARLGKEIDCIFLTGTSSSDCASAAECAPVAPAGGTHTMPPVSDLASRIDAEFSVVEQKVKQFQTQQVQEHRDRQKRLEQLGTVFDQLTEIAKPRLELLVKKFGDRVQTTPRLVPSTREVSFSFQSRVARVNLKFSASTDRDIQKVTLSYDLEIIPVLMRFKPHDEIEFPINSLDKEAVAAWVDDHIVEFIRTYFAMGENEIYLKDYMVEDPIAHVRFPKMAAAATVEHGGQTYYFVGDETRCEFEKQHTVAAK